MKISHEKINKRNLYIIPVYTLHIVLGSNFKFVEMKELDNFLEKVGVDKILHHLLGALICAFISFVVIIQEGVIDWHVLSYPFIGFVAVLFLSVIKEILFDDKADWMDVVWSVAGCVWVFIAVAIGILFVE